MNVKSLSDDDSWDEEKNISNNWYAEYFLLIPSKIIRKNLHCYLNDQFMISHVALKDVNFLSKYAVFLILRVLSFWLFHWSYHKMFIDTFKKQYIFSSENIYSVYFIFWYHFFNQMTFKEKNNFGFGRSISKTCVEHMSGQIYTTLDILTDG